jgi:multicomponent Na+:H+ antiporter subunit E
MVIVPTSQRSAGGLTAVGLVTSLIVDNQLVDLDRDGAQLQYHAVEVP